MLLGVGANLGKKSRAKQRKIELTARAEAEAARAETGDHPHPVAGRPLALALASYVALAIAWAAPSSLSPAETVPNYGDPLHLAWVMAWDAHQIARHPLALFEGNAFYPHVHSLAFGDHLLPEALLVAPVSWATGNAVLASNVGVVAALALSAAAVFVLVSSLTGSPGAAWVAGLAYAFNSFTLHELPRVHVLNVQWWPLALFGLDRFVRAGAGARDAALFAGGILMQCLSGTYYLAYSAMFTPLWIAAAYAFAERRPSPRAAKVLATAAALALLPLAVMVLPYVRQFRALGLAKKSPERLLALPAPALAVLHERGFEGGFAPGTDAAAYVDPPMASVLWGRFSGALPSEVPHFVGFFSAALALAGVFSLSRRRPGRAVGLVALTTAAAAFLLSLGSRVRVAGADWGTGPYDVLYHQLPFAKGMASPERFGILVVLGVAILTGLGAARLLPRCRPAWRPWLLALTGTLLLLDHWQVPAAGASFPSGGDVPRVYEWLAGEGDGAIVDLPLYDDREKRLWATYLAFSTRHWRRLPIGRTSFYPPLHDRLAWELRGFPDDRSLTVLDRLGIRTLVVHPAVWPEELRTERVAALGRDRRLTLAKTFDDEPAPRFRALRLGHERVYRLSPLARGAPPCQPEDLIPRDRWTLTGSGLTAPDLARDGRPDTAWFTLEPQRAGDHLRVDLPSPETVAAVTLDMAYPYEEFPRGLDLVIPDAAGDAQPVEYADGPEEAAETIAALADDPRHARIVLRIRPRVVHDFALVLGTHDRDWAAPRWSVPEVRAYRACR